MLTVLTPLKRFKFIKSPHALSAKMLNSLMSFSISARIMFACWTMTGPNKKHAKTVQKLSNRAPAAANRADAV